MLSSKPAPVDRGAIDDLLQTCPIVRMSSIQHRLNGDFHRGVAFEYPIGLVGPVDFPALWIPSEASGVAQPLRLRQIYFTLAKRFLRPFPFGAFAGFA